MRTRKVFFIMLAAIMATIGQALPHRLPSDEPAAASVPLDAETPQAEQRDTATDGQVTRDAKLSKRGAGMQ
jgi:hypothetical protein